jgi:serine/threonine-protein kinase
MEPAQAESSFHGYRLLRRIARGGMAEVWLASRQGAAGFERRVALKRILPVYAGLDEFVHLFRDEARLLASMHHSGIVQVTEFGSADGELFIAMEYVDGPDLEEVLDRCRRRGVLPPVEVVLSIGLRVADALEYAHAAVSDSGEPLQVVHRDISPPNVLLGVQGDVKLTDFGVAKAVQREAQTRPGVLRGKYAYMSPEQVRHQPIDRRSDLFSLGIVLYEALTGVNPFEGTSDYQTMEAVQRGEVEPAGFLRPDTPADLDRVLLACLEHNRDDRYADAGKLRQDLLGVAWDVGASDEPELIQRFLRDLFPERTAAAPKKADGDLQPWEPLAHRLSPMLVAIPRVPVAPPRMPLRVGTTRGENRTPPRARLTPGKTSLPPDPPPVTAPPQDGAVWREVGPRAKRGPERVERAQADPDAILTRPGVEAAPFLPGSREDDSGPHRLEVADLRRGSEQRKGAARRNRDEATPLAAGLPDDAPADRVDAAPRTEDGLPWYNEWGDDEPQAARRLPEVPRSDPPPSPPAASWAASDLPGAAIDALLAPSPRRRRAVTEPAQRAPERPGSAKPAPVREDASDLLESGGLDVLPNRVSRPVLRASGAALPPVPAPPPAVVSSPDEPPPLAPWSVAPLADEVPVPPIVPWRPPSLAWGALAVLGPGLLLLAATALVSLRRAPPPSAAGAPDVRDVAPLRDPPGTLRP